MTGKYWVMEAINCLCKYRSYLPGALFPWLTVYENIEFELKVSKLSRYERKDVR
jgi:ABC-type transporter Mla maintaining outer membrane lipid asymmetry ATPase subunit MlaF